MVLLRECSTKENTSLSGWILRKGIFLFLHLPVYTCWFEPLQNVFISLLLLAQFVFSNTCLQIPASSNLIGRNKYKAKDSEMPRSVGSELVFHHTSELTLKSDFWNSGRCNQKPRKAKWNNDYTHVRVMFVVLKLVLKEWTGVCINLYQTLTAWPLKIIIPQSDVDISVLHFSTWIQKYCKSERTAQSQTYGTLLPNDCDVIKQGPQVYTGSAQYQSY